jgi:hypothetical protein
MSNQQPRPEGRSIKPLSTNKMPQTGGRRIMLRKEGRQILSLLDERPVTENDITTTESGRPFFPGRQADFSISHSGALAVVSFAKGENLRTGCDVELVRPRANAAKIAESFFSSAEREYIFEKNKDAEIRFFKIWTLKECFLKLRALSVFEMEKAPSFIGDDGLFSFYEDDLRETSSPSLIFYLYELSSDSNTRYVLASALEGDNLLKPEIRWFSQYFLPVRSIAEIKAAAKPADTVSPKR